MRCGEPMVATAVLQKMRAAENDSANRFLQPA